MEPGDRKKEAITAWALCLAVEAANIQGVPGMTENYLLQQPPPGACEYSLTPPCRRNSADLHHLSVNVSNTTSSPLTTYHIIAYHIVATHHIIAIHLFHAQHLRRAHSSWHSSTQKRPQHQSTVAFTATWL